MSGFIHLDSNEAIFFERELDYVKAQTYDRRFPEFKAVNGLIPISTEAGEGAETITYQSYDEVGVAKIIANYASDLPVIDIKGKEVTNKVKGIGASYGYSKQDIRAARMAGKPLEARKAAAVRRADSRKVDDVAWIGDEEYGLVGLLNHPNVTKGTVAEVSSETEWSEKTPLEIYADMAAMISDTSTLTNGVERPNTLLMDTPYYEIVASTKLADGTDTTILEFFKKNYPEVTVDWVAQFGSYVGRVDGISGDFMVSYYRDPSHLTLEIPLPFTQHPPEEVNLSYKVNCESRCGGTIVYYPLSVLIRGGIGGLE
jgi:hypothetical protein